jgi:site-specific DNA-methyltransferase (adenine-specific)
MPPAKSDTHVTPDRVYEMIEKTWGIERSMMFDPCPINGTDGLIISWKDINFVNPPYSLLKEFVQKALDESSYGNRTVMLLPSKTDQAWFHDLVYNHDGVEIKWIKGRLRFVNNIEGISARNGCESLITASIPLKI